MCLLSQEIYSYLILKGYGYYGDCPQTFSSNAKIITHFQKYAFPVDSLTFQN